jgi:uncharacterized membrane protein SirB2
VLELLFAGVVARVPVLREWLHRLARPFRASTSDGDDVADIPEGVDAVRWVKIAAIALVVGLFILGVLRPRFGFDYFGYHDARIRSYDERSLWRLALFFTWVGLALAVLGAVTVLWQRWRRERIALFGVLLVFTVLFLLHAKNSPQMMWWGRRYVPLVVPGLLLMAGVGVAISLQFLRERRNSPLFVVLVLVVVAVVGIQARQSWALRGHDEKAGSYGVAQSVGALSGGQRGVFLWQRGRCCAAPHLLFGSPTWIIGHSDSGVLPNDQAEWLPYAQSVQKAVPRQPLFMVLDAGTQPPTAAGLTLTMTQRFTGSLPVWEESNHHRPSHALTIPYDFVVYRLVLTG